MLPEVTHSVCNLFLWSSSRTENGRRDHADSATRLEHRPLTIAVLISLCSTVGGSLAHRMRAWLFQVVQLARLAAGAVRLPSNPCEPSSLRLSAKSHGHEIVFHLEIVSKETVHISSPLLDALMQVVDFGVGLLAPDWLSGATYLGEENVGIYE